jgi:hypothetical protein
MFNFVNIQQFICWNIASIQDAARVNAPGPTHLRPTKLALPFLLWTKSEKVPVLSSPVKPNDCASIPTNTSDSHERTKGGPSPALDNIQTNALD